MTPNIQKEKLDKDLKLVKIHKLLSDEYIDNNISEFDIKKDDTGNEKYEQSFKKKIEAKKKLSVRRNLESIYNYTFKIFWKEIQYYINMNIIMSFFNERKDFENSLIYSLGYLQSMTSAIKPDRQKVIMNFNHIKI